VLRALFYLLTIVIVITVVKSVIGIFAKLFADVTAQPHPPGQAPGRQSSQSPQMLKKDPVCGTFVADSTEFQKTKGGMTYYFCSAACRDKF
jgi:YHS domain-containing protein